MNRYPYFPYLQFDVCKIRQKALSQGNPAYTGNFPDISHEHRHNKSDVQVTTCSQMICSNGVDVRIGVKVIEKCLFWLPL
jgi:hypothetical protein